jgi:quinoprotein relay system zinc metallohydrolase 2
VRALASLLTCLLVLAGMATAVAAEAEPLPLKEVAPGVHVYEAPYALAARENGGAIANLGVVIGEQAVAVIDTGGSLRVGERLLAAVRRLTDRPVRYVINTHVHPDHLLGNAAFPGATVVGHRHLPQALAARGGPYLAANGALLGPAFEGTRLVPPTLLVESSLSLDLGGRRLTLEAWPTAHTNSDLTVLDEATGTWFLGDLLFAGHVPALDGRLKGWRAVLDRMRSRVAARVVPGHGPAAMPWPAAADPLARYLGTLETELRALIREGRPLSEAIARTGRTEEGRWSLFPEFHQRNATAAYQELEWE